MNKPEFKVSEENKQRLQENYGVDLDKLDDATRNSLLGMYDPSKSSPVAKICEYLGYFFFLISIFALFRLHWITLIISALIGLLFTVARFLIQHYSITKKLKALSNIGPLLSKARNTALTEGYASPALFQRKLKIPYSIAAHLVELLEGEGLIGPPDGAKPRPILSKKILLAKSILKEAEDEYPRPAFDLIHEEINSRLFKFSKQFDEAAKDTKIEQIVYATIGEIAGDLAESGRFHIYRGVFDPSTGIGEDLLKIYDDSADKLVQMGAIDKDFAKRQKSTLRNRIKQVG